MKLFCIKHVVKIVIMNGLNKFPSRLTKPLETTPTLNVQISNKQTKKYNNIQ